MKCRAILMLTASMLLCGMTGTTFANNGFYLGVDAGAANLMDKESHTLNPESHQLGAVNPVLGGYLGYDYGLSNRVRIAAEAFVDHTWMQTSIEHAGNTYKMNQHYNVGLRLLPAYAFAPDTSGHVILGFANGRFKIKDNGVYGTVNSTHNASGWQVGAGLDRALQNNFFVRLDALYDFYNAKTTQGSGLISGTTQLYSNRFSQLAGELSVYYKFA